MQVLWPAISKNTFFHTLFLLILFAAVFSAGELLSFENQTPQKNVVVKSRGFASIASGDDINCLYLNPAGLGYLFYNELSFSYNNTYGIGLHNGYFALGFPMLSALNAALGYEYLTYRDSELSLADHNISAAGGRELGISGLYGGLSMSYKLSSLELDGEAQETINYFALNAGLIYDNFDFIKFLEPLAIGVVFRNIVNTSDYSTNTADIFSRLNYGFGISYIFKNSLTAEFDYYRETLNLGLEYWLYQDTLINIIKKKKGDISHSFTDRLVALRAGVIYDRKSDSPFIWPERLKVSAGAGFNAKIASVNYALVFGGQERLDHSVSFSMKFGFASSYIQVTESIVKDLFSSMHKSYKDLSVGHVKMKNNSRKHLVVDIDLNIKGFMDAPTTRQVIIRPGKEQLFPLFAVFNDAVMKIDEDKPMQADITYSYTYNKKKIIKKIAKSFIMYEKNAFTWDNKKQIAVFVTPKDPVVADFTRQIIHLYKGETSGLLPENFEKAMQIFNALGTFGMTYVRDPNSAYAKTAGKGAVDNVQFPVETLRKKTGDCDDSAVLYCSMLESIGIETAIVDLPDHVLMMFNTGLSADQASQLSKNTTDYIIRKDQVWVLVETTMFKNGFYKAWKEGMLEYWKWQQGK